MNNRMILVFALVVFVICSNCSQGDSIWARRDRNMKALYADDVARQIGDVLTIKITENSTVDNKAKRDLDKETSRSTNFNGELGITTPGHNLLPRIPGFTMQADSSDKLSGKADYKDERSFVDALTVVVVDIMPNGNLVVMGARNRDIAGDVQNIEMSGIVRPSDIAFDNTVSSEKVADFRVVSKNAGVAEPYNRQGWLGRIFDIVSPF